MKRIVISNQYPEFCRCLEKRGYKTIPSDKIQVFNVPEQKHADMQLLPINDKLFILNECDKLKDYLADYELTETKAKAGKSYPENILLNFLFLNNKLYGKLSSMDNSIREYCCANNIEIININQGYARCSTLVINNRRAITSDKSIEKALKNDGAEVLLINPGYIRLEGYDYGFIGGCSGRIEDTVYFFGDLDSHPDKEIIKQFISDSGCNTKSLCPDLPLTDIGGLVIL